MIVTDVIDTEEADEDGSIYDDGADLYEEYGSGLVEAGVSTDVTEVGTREVTAVQRDVKDSSL